MTFTGYLRADGRKGIRNVVAVVYTGRVRAPRRREIAEGVRADVHLIGFAGCYPNAYARDDAERLCTHPNVGAVLLVSLGCEGFNRDALRAQIAATGRPVRRW